MASSCLGHTGRKFFSFQHTPESSNGESTAEEIDTNQPCRKDIREMMKKVGVRDAIDGRIDGDREEDDGCNVFEPDTVRWSNILIGRYTHLFVTRGIMAPLVRVSTKRINGMMDKTLWCDENGINQWTTRL